MVACSHVSTVPHMGHREISDAGIVMDSVVVDADSTSLRGNFVMMDSSLFFVDQLYCRIFEYSFDRGCLSASYSRYGQGPNEMVGIMYGAVVHPSDTAMWVLDSSNGIYEFTPSDGCVNYKGRIDFSWDRPENNDYSSPSCYNVMQMSDFGVSLWQIDDTTMLMPLSLVNRNLSGINGVRYRKGHVLGLVNTVSLAVDGAVGSFPEYYHSNPLPSFEFFDFAVDKGNSRIYVNHAPDSLIYSWNMEYEPVNTIGFEPEDIDRNYTVGFAFPAEAFMKDIQHVGVNTGMYFDEEDGVLLRTSMTDFPTGKVIMQVYKEDDLIHEAVMPPYFKILGKHGGCYYGVRFLPVEDGDSSSFVFYRFKL